MATSRSGGEGTPNPPSAAGDAGRAPHPHPSPVGRELLKSLLRERNQSPDRLAEIERRIVETFQRRVAVLVLDLCGFSRLTQRHGILFYLAMVVQMEEAARPAVANNGGTIFKQEADNLFAVFRTPAEAVEAALDIFIAFNAVNSVMPSDRDLHAAVGIGFGDLLVIGEKGGLVEDIFGNEMNGACRLGEDAGCKGEILLTSAARAALPPNVYVIEPIDREHRGSRVDGYRYLRRAVEDDAESAE